FPLRAYLIIVFGDIPAISMIMRMKGHNGLSPCRFCHIHGLRIPGSRATTNYVPLSRKRHPDVISDPDAIKVYQPEDLPLRSHDEFLNQEEAVERASTEAERERLAKTSGIKGVPLLSCLASLSFPASFPYDFMHLIWENVIKNLILLWTGEYKDLDTGSEDYKLDKKIWDAIGEATAASGSTIPSAYGPRQPNIAQDRSGCTADSWSFWTLYIGPVLLNRRFKHEKYYRHFIDLVSLLDLCLSFEYSDEDIKAIDDGFIAWVQMYER
ncbi:hypothetical protein PUNSTDRAFT_28999, partial [Punctularia strigosozonata HHB-11173 SS5]|uniref:uncharacterized protein n=1 Tax=Punctularia strigosozonata (strain HHB-11173) TaxID=741275 RepID=UPI00044175C3